MEQKKWWETAEPMIISAVQCNFGENSYDILRRHTVGRGFNTEQLYHLTASGSMSYYNEEKGVCCSLVGEVIDKLGVDKVDKLLALSDEFIDTVIDLRK